MFKATLKSLMLLALINLNSALAWSPFGPNNFNDCVLDAMKGVTNDTAAQMVYKSCQQKFPDGAPNTSSGYVSDCVATYSGGTFVKGKPLDMSQYLGVSFQHSTSLIYVPSNMKSDADKINLIIRQNAQTIKRICPDIQLD
jgi:hypothetical protein